MNIESLSFARLSIRIGPSAINATAPTTGSTPSAADASAIQGGFVHTFNAILPPNEYFPKHPEWFSEIGGKRVGSTNAVQWCLTNPELLAFCIQRVKAILRTAPPDSIVSVSQNDCDCHCQCAKCLAIEKEEGSPSGPLLRFVNAVADAVKDEYPHAAIDTLAYQYTHKPPRLTKPRPNVIIRLCSIECSLRSRSIIRGTRALPTT